MTMYQLILITGVFASDTILVDVLQPLQEVSVSMDGTFVADEITKHPMPNQNMIVSQKGLD